MPAHFFKLSQPLLDASENHCVITPNERLCREYLRAYNEIQLQKGRTAWARPDVISLKRYLLRGHADRPGDRRLLSRDAEFVLWQQLAEPGSEPLAGLARDAWQVAHQWRMDASDPRFTHTPNARADRDWATRFAEHLDAAGLVTEAELPAVLDAPAESLMLLAFDVVPPTVRDYLERVEAAGGRVSENWPAVTRPARTRKRVEATSRGQEVSMAAQWNRQVLNRQPTARIGVVVPYLTQSYDMVDHAFGVEFEAAPDAYDLAGGMALSQQAVWQAASSVLRLTFAKLAHAELVRLASLPFTDFAEMTLPSGLREEVGIEDLDRHQSMVDALLDVRPANISLPFPRWVAAFRDALAAAGWGRALGSVQFQAHQAIGEALQAFTGLPELGPCTADTALTTVEQLLSERMFAPQRPAAPVQILGPLETTGLTFTHLWVAGLQDTAWPAVPTPNPLLPIALQRECAVPRADQAAEREFATTQLQHWTESTRTLIVSHAVEDGEEQHRCSELARDIDLVDRTKVVSKYRARRHPWLVSMAKAALEPVLEQSGSRLPGPITKGGTTLLRNQAQCPFRAWSIHRLALDEPRSPHSFPDPLERGLLVHEALYELYAANDMDANVDEKQIRQAAETTVGKHLRHAPRLYRDTEIERLQRLLTAWSDLEKTRPPFAIVGLELESELELPGVRLKLRIDRLDEVPTDSGVAQVVIDYKTGAIVPNRLVIDRLIEPQLPIYALTTPVIRAALFAGVADERMRLAGVADESLDLGSIHRAKLPAGGWPELRDRWQNQLRELVDEYLAGYAAVQPHTGAVCTNCHLKSLCRVGAMVES